MVSHETMNSTNKHLGVDKILESEYKYFNSKFDLKQK